MNEIITSFIIIRVREAKPLDIPKGQESSLSSIKGVRSLRKVRSFVSLKLSFHPPFISDRSNTLSVRRAFADHSTTVLSYETNTLEISKHQWRWQICLKKIMNSLDSVASSNLVPHLPL